MVLSGVLFRILSWRLRLLVVVVVLLQSLEINGVVSGGQNNVTSEDSKVYQSSQGLKFCNLTSIGREDYGCSVNDRKSVYGEADRGVGGKRLFELGHKAFNETFQEGSEQALTQRIVSPFNLSDFLSDAYEKSDTHARPLFGRKMAEYELIHRDQITFRPIGYHEFDLIPEVIHQIPQHQYQMFRSGYLGYPYNPIDYYRSPYISTVKRNRTRRLLSGDLDGGYRVEYEIMEFINGNNNSLFNQ